MAIAESQSKESVLENIRRVESDIRATKFELKVKNEELDGILADMPEHKKVVTLSDQLATARKELKAAMAGDSEVAVTADAIGEHTFKLTDLKAILGLHVMEYRDLTQTAYVPEADSKKVRPMKIRVELGKPEYLQEEMELFAEAPGREYSIEDEKTKVTVNQDGIKKEAKPPKAKK